MMLYSILINGVVLKGRKVLVSRRSWNEPHEPGKWTIPGGKVEKIDNVTFNILEKNLKREIKEETGVTIKNNVEMITNNSFMRDDGSHVVAIIFKCHYGSGKVRPLEDTIDCKWVSVEEVKKMKFAPSVKKYIMEAF